MRHAIRLAALLSVLSGPALAFCEDMAALGNDGGMLASPDGGAIVECTTSLQLGGEVQTQCGWPFAYRSQDAADAFTRLNDTVVDCLGTDVMITQDQSVNHPDFYDLRMYQSEAQEIGVSLKDKAALQQTYVFLRLSPS
jgi:hypothetical protein